MVRDFLGRRGRAGQRDKENGRDSDPRHARQHRACSRRFARTGVPGREVEDLRFLPFPFPSSRPADDAFDSWTELVAVVPKTADGTVPDIRNGDPDCWLLNMPIEPTGVQSLPRELELADGEALTLRVFIDKNLVEVFANDRQAAMFAVKSPRAAPNVSLYARGGDATVRSVKAWRMQTIYQADPVEK